MAGALHSTALLGPHAACSPLLALLLHLSAAHADMCGRQLVRFLKWVVQGLHGASQLVLILAATWFLVRPCSTPVMPCPARYAQHAMLSMPCSSCEAGAFEPAHAQPLALGFYYPAALSATWTVCRHGLLPGLAQPLACVPKVRAVLCSAAVGLEGQAGGEDFGPLEAGGVSLGLWARWEGVVWWLGRCVWI